MKLIKIILLLASFSANAIELYVDEHTGQVFTSPGKHRNHLGDFEQKDTKTKSATVADIKHTEDKINTRHRILFFL